MATKRQLLERWTTPPGAEIRQKIIDNCWQQIGSGNGDNEAWFSLLTDLPYRHEVVGGRDFRGADFLSGHGLDFSSADFSYATILGNLFRCNLNGAVFDHSQAERNAFDGSSLVGATFRKTKYRAPSFSDCDLQNACFDDARLHNPSFENAKAQGASFRNADLRGAVFFGADLSGCDFRGANLACASLYGTKVDRRTDFRGANLLNASIEDRFDNSRHLIGWGLDLKTAQTDATTCLGEAPSLLVFEHLAAALRWIENDDRAEAGRLRQAIESTTANLKKEYTADWIDALLAQLPPEDHEFAEEVLTDTIGEFPGPDGEPSQDDSP